MNNFALNVPINTVSFGQVSTALLREVHKKGLQPPIFPIGQPDLSSQKSDPSFEKWLQDNINRAQTIHNKANVSIKLWHLNGSLDSVSRDQILLTFLETNELTDTEINIAKQQKRILVTSKHTLETFNNYGVNNVELIHLGFDSYNFKPIYRLALEDRIVFSVVGKFENRKGHEQLIKAWIKKYGNNPKYFLNCAIYNPFLRRQVNGQVIDDNMAIWHNLVENKRVFNVQFNGHMGTNAEYNDYLNYGNIVIGMGTEGWGMPEFQSVGLGKHAIILNAGGYKEWATAENSVLVEPKGMKSAVDNVFFHPNTPFNVGNIFDWDTEEFLAACDKAIQRVETDKVNKAGLKIQQDFTYEKTWMKIYSTI